MTYTSPSGVASTYAFGLCPGAAPSLGCPNPGTYYPDRSKIVRLTIGGYVFNYSRQKYDPNVPDGKGLLKNTGPDGHIVSWTARSRPVYHIDNLGRQTSYFYTDNLASYVDKVIDPDATPNLISPTGGYSDYDYDSRGNITAVRVLPKNGGTALVSSATYPTNCSNAKTCNKPLTITDPAGVTTTYEYSATHGGMLTETKPAVNGIQVQTRYGYAPHTPYVKNSAGSLVASNSVWRLVSISKCVTQTLDTCVGTVDEFRTEIVYGTNNILPVSRTLKRGDGSLAQTTTMDYDIYGNLTYEDGPRPGMADATYYHYDALRRVIGVIGPDPDGSGSRPRRATRTSYNDDGQVDSVVKGVVYSTTLADLNAMSAREQLSTEYSTSTGLPMVERHYANGVLQKVTQKSYDSKLRLDCVAQRLNPSAFNSLPTSACMLGSAGPEGNDRITRMTYDPTGALFKTTSAYGTALQRDDRPTPTIRQWVADRANRRQGQSHGLPLRRLQAAGPDDLSARQQRCGEQHNRLCANELHRRARDFDALARRPGDQFQP